MDIMNEMRGWNSPVQDVDISEEKLNHFNGGTPCNRYGKYDANAYPDEYRMFLAKFGSLI